MQVANSVMSTNVVTVKPEDSLLSAWKLMCEQNILHLPVADASGVVVGMLSDRDVQRAMVVDRPAGDAEEIFLTATKKVSGFMTPTVFSVRMETTISSIIEEMLKRKVSAIVVLDDHLCCVGIVTSTDILGLFLDQIKRSEENLNKPLSFFFPNTLY